MHLGTGLISFIVLTTLGSTEAISSLAGAVRAFTFRRAQLPVLLSATKVRIIFWWNISLYANIQYDCIIISYILPYFCPALHGDPESHKQPKVAGP